VLCCFTDADDDHYAWYGSGAIPHSANPAGPMLSCNVLFYEHDFAGTALLGSYIETKTLQVEHFLDAQ
jgi:hypothetical protein